MIAIGIAMGIIIGLNATVLVWVKMRSDAIDSKIEDLHRALEAIFGGEASSSASSEGEEA